VVRSGAAPSLLVGTFVPAQRMTIARLPVTVVMPGMVPFG
jgi:hypothetical protein